MANKQNLNNALFPAEINNKFGMEDRICPIKGILSSIGKELKKLLYGSFLFMTKIKRIKIFAIIIYHFVK